MPRKMELDVFHTQRESSSALCMASDNGLRGSETTPLGPTAKSRRANSVAATPAAWRRKRGERGKRPNGALMRRCKRKASCCGSRGL